MTYTKNTIRARQLMVVLIIALTLSAFIAPAPSGIDGRTLAVALLGLAFIATTRTEVKR